MSDLTRPERCVAIRDAREKLKRRGGCPFCKKRLEGTMQQVWCSVGLKWPACAQMAKPAFELDEEVLNGSG